MKSLIVECSFQLIRGEFQRDDNIFSGQLGKIL